MAKEKPLTNKEKNLTDPSKKQYWLEKLSHPIEEEGVLSPEEMQRIYDMARRQQQGTWNTGLEALKGQLGTRGYTPGESGIADTALGNYMRAQTEGLGMEQGKIAQYEAERRMKVGEMALNRLLGAGGIAAQRHGGGGAGRAANAQLEWEKEKFAQTFPFEKQQASFNNLFNLYSALGSSQQQAYAPYLSGMSQY